MLSPPSTRAPPSDVSEEDSIDISTLVTLGLSVGDIEKLWASAPVDAEQVRAAAERLLRQGSDTAVPVSRMASFGLDLVRRGSSNVDGLLAALNAELENPPDRFCDPIMFTLMDEPVVLSSGHHFDRTTVLDERGKLRFQRCPMTRERLMPTAYPLLFLRREIVEFKVRRLDAVLAAAERCGEGESRRKLLGFARGLLRAVGGFHHARPAAAFWKMRLSGAQGVRGLIDALKELQEDEVRTVSRAADDGAGGAGGGTSNAALHLLEETASTVLADRVRAVAQGDGGWDEASPLLLEVVRGLTAIADRPAWVDVWLGLIAGAVSSAGLVSEEARELLADAFAALSAPTSVEYWSLRLSLCAAAPDRLPILQQLRRRLEPQRIGRVERVVVSGAGVGPANGTYERDGEYEGAPLFKNGDQWMLRYRMPSGNLRWYIADRHQLSSDDGDLYWIGSEALLPPCSLPWNLAKDGRAPVPTMSLVRAATSLVESSAAPLLALLAEHAAKLRSAGVPTAPLDQPLPPAGALASISGRRGWWVDRLSLNFRDGAAIVYGQEGGDAVEDFELREGEAVVGVCQWSSGQFLGEAIELLTSEGRTHRIASMLPRWRLERIAEVYRPQRVFGLTTSARAAEWGGDMPRWSGGPAEAVEGEVVGLRWGNRAEQPNVLCAVLVRSGSGGEAWHETRVLDEEPFLGGEDGGDGGELGVGDASALGASAATLGDASEPEL